MQPPPVLGDGGALTDNCAPNNNEHNTNMIKIAWRMGNANGTDNNQQSTTYTYMLEVGN
ncbi:hypothetical protein [Kingella kingae]|uniref:hypothetical protein n=1 Tax=Kingella kingae TaxID=504 RepID=UPI002556E47A|nr:hypothetical protein [Kingella kingae]